MPVTPVVTVDGLGDLRRALRKLGEDAADLKEANAAVAAFVANVAAGRAPRRSGRLGASVRGNRAVSRARVTAGGGVAPYAGPIHWGWPARHIEGDPFVIDAAQSTQDVWLALYVRDLDRLTDRVGGTY